MALRYINVRKLRPGDVFTEECGPSVLWGLTVSETDVQTTGDVIAVVTDGHSEGPVVLPCNLDVWVRR